VIVEVGGNPVQDLESFQKMTASITEGKTEPVPTVVAFERKAERFLTLVEVGIKAPQDPTPEARKAWFPAATQVLSRKLAIGLGLKGKKGVRITQIYPETAAEKDFRVGDILTQLDGQAIEASQPQDGEVFETMIRAYKIGSTAEVTVIRAGETIQVPIVLGEAPKPERELKVYEDHVLEFKARDIAYFDRIEHRWTKEESGALICQVEQGGWASFGGLGMDDLIQGIDGQPIATAKDLEAALKGIEEKRPKRIDFLVKRGIHTMFVELEPTWAEKH
jgi:S1-C subfamily serine protease